MTLDLKITNGIVVDGTGLARRRADVGVRDGRIVALGHVGEHAKRTIDADGRIVAPGIVDAHTHYDPQIAFDPYATSSCYHGVTTVTTGNCGYSVAPCRDDDRDFMVRMFAAVEAIHPDALESADWEAADFPDFLERRRGGLGVNLAMYVGHSAVRRFVMGTAASERAATGDEIATMVQVVETSVAAGAAGFSSTRGPNQFDGDGVPVPSRYASAEELRALVAAAGATGSGTIAFLPESGGAAFADAELDELIDLSLTARQPVIVQGLGGASKVDAPRSEDWNDVKKFFARAAEAGAAVFSLLRVQPFDRPFTFERGTLIYAAVPALHDLFASSRDAKVAALSDPSERDRLRRALAAPNIDPKAGATVPPPSWSSLLVNDARRPENQPLVGRSIASIAAELGQDPFDVMADLALSEALEIEFVFRNEHEDWLRSVDEAQGHPNMILGVSDGGAHLDRDDASWWTTYFLRHWVLDRQRWTLEAGIRQITHVPAALLGFSDRGLLLPGYSADMFIFDPDEIGPGSKQFVHDLPAGAGRYSARPNGVLSTIVNGEPIVWQGELTGALPGQIASPGTG